MTDYSKIEVLSRGFAKMLSPEVTEQLGRFHMQSSMQQAGCLLRLDDQGPRGENPPIIEPTPFHRSRVYTGTRLSGSFNHHSQLATFKGRYYLGWSNGLVNEEAAGQRILLASSEDARNWSEPACIVGDRDEESLASNCVALYATEETLYLVGMTEETTHDETVPGMRRISPDSQQMSVYASGDARTWEKVFTFSDKIRWIFEAPRLTADGHLLCVAYTESGPAVLRWPGDQLCEQPEMIAVPEPHGSAFPYGESTWYQIDDGTIVIFWRDEGRSCHAWVNTSTDNGRTFSEPVISDIPDSMSRLYAGRLSDGRYYLINNTHPELLNRMHLMILLSDDGYVFNKIGMLIDDPTAQRLIGLLKCDGYQYPCAMVDGEDLLVAYSVNKEDIECGCVKINEL